MNLTCTYLVFRKLEPVKIQKLNVKFSAKSTMLFGAEGQRDVTRVCRHLIKRKK